MNIVVFQEAGSAEKKVKGILKFGEKITITNMFSINATLPEFVENPEEYITSEFNGELVLNFLKHPDLSDYLVDLCTEKQIPVVTTGKPGKGFTPFTCCGLGKSETLGEYGRQFGFPAYSIEVTKGIIQHIHVQRGAPCGATWEAVVNLIGCPVKEALTKLPLQVQQNCFANPAGFDPISGKSPLHYAGHVHIAALKKALEECQKKN